MCIYMCFLGLGGWGSMDCENGRDEDVEGGKSGRKLAGYGNVTTISLFLREGSGSLMHI